MLARVSSPVSAATSASRMRLSAAAKFSFATRSPAMAVTSRLSKAPRVPRVFATFAIAEVSTPSADWAAPCVEAAMAVWPARMPESEPSTELKLIWELLLPSRPTCTATVVPALRSCTPLKVVVLEMRLISDRSCENSCWMALRCVSLTVPVADSEASSERRVRTSVTLPSAFSPIASEEMPSLALRTAWAATRTSRSSLSAIARPAASSEALLMRSAGEMGYLARRTAGRIDPRTAFPWARSIVSLAYPYRPPPVPAGDWRAELRGRIAAYALGVDYHDRVGALLERLIERLRDVFPAARFRPYVDTGPVLEREWAARAGLGWIGKNTLLLHRSAGSYFFLAELLTDLSLDAVPLPADHCGTCTRCLTACPTGALEAYAMDPRRCISYLTIEHRSATRR